jgi:hypothetical protein
MKIAGFSLIGAALGLVMGTWNFVSFWMDPLNDSLVGMLVTYVPMFICWAVVGFVAARRTGRLADAAKAGAACAFSTFVVFWIANIIRVNVFLDVLREWPDWQTVRARYYDSGIESFRWFVNYDYLKDAPLKLATPTAIGATLAVIAGMAAKLGPQRRVPSTPSE